MTRDACRNQVQGSWLVQRESSISRKKPVAENRPTKGYAYLVFQNLARESARLPQVRKWSGKKLLQSQGKVVEFHFELRKIDILKKNQGTLK